MLDEITLHRSTEARGLHMAQDQQNTPPRRQPSHARHVRTGGARTAPEGRHAAPMRDGAAQRFAAAARPAAARSVAAASPGASALPAAAAHATESRPAAVAHATESRPAAAAQSRAAVRPATVSGASSGAYRRTDDGSGYRPVRPDGGKGGKGGKGKRGPWRVVFWVALAVFVVSLGALGALMFSYWQGQNAYDKIAEQAFEPPDDIEAVTLADLQVDWDALRAVNPDVIGWIYIPGTIVNYPIVQTDNDERYLTYDFNGQQGWGATFGTIFLQAVNRANFADDNNVIYGHNLNNGSMFACIADFADAEQFNAHRTVYLLTPQGNYKLRTFSLVHCPANDPLAQVYFVDDAEQTAYVQDKIDRSVVASDEKLPAAADITQTFALVTCDNLPSDGRYVLFGYVEETTVSGQHAVGGEQQSDGAEIEGAQEAVDAGAQEELAAA